MIGTLSVGLAVEEAVRSERILPVGEVGDAAKGELREGGVETARLNREFLGEGVLSWPRKVVRVGEISTGGGTAGRRSEGGGVTLSVGCGLKVGGGIFSEKCGVDSGRPLAILP